MTVTLEEIRNLVGRQLGTSRVAREALIVEDLGAESVDLMNIVAALEDRYGIAIDEGELPDLRTVGDLFERVRAGTGG
jgi:acyl carrier protein